MNWLANFFLNPAFVLPGVALISAPVIIHLINRMRYRRVRWAAMEFLLASQQRNRRRLLLEQLLLLLLRIFVVLGIVALIARPFVDPQQLSFFQGQKTHHLVLIDDSGSMNDRWGETSAFAGGLDVVKKIASEGARRPGTQTLTLLLLSNPSQPLFTLRTLDPPLVVDLDRKLETLRSSHRRLDLPAAIDSARKLLAEQPGAAKNFHLISDFRRREWEEESALPAALREMSEAKIAVNLVKTVPARHVNLGVTELSGSVDVAAANVPLRLKVVVKNYSDQGAKNVRLTILTDGKKLPVSVVIDALEAGAESTREFDVVFPTTGPHDVRVALPADALEQDNERFLALDIADANPVLIVDGDSTRGDAVYLQDALAPAPGLTGFAPTVESVDYLRRHPIDKFQSVFLLNVAELHPDAQRALESYVAAGGGLCWYLGEQVRPAFYSDKLYKAGSGLFPAKLGSIADLLIDEVNPAPDIVFTPHPMFRVFEGQDNPFVDSVKVTRYFSTAKDWTPDPGTRVIASLRNRAPLFLEHRFGKGTIITCLTSCDTAWNNWPRNPSFVVMQLELERHIARGDHALDLRIVGEPIRIALDAATYSPNVEIRLPDATSERVTAVIDAKKQATPGSSATASAAQFVDEFRSTDAPGLYALALKRLDGGDEVQRFAYNVPESESFLELATNERLRERVGTDVPLLIQEVGDFDWVHGEQAGQEIHDFVLFLLLAFLVCEQLLALRLSYHPKPNEVRA